MLNQEFAKVYDRFKLQFYKNVFDKIQNRELTLTAVETFCMEIIHAMDRPTVGEFASYVQISSPNAAYKVNSLINKGYLKKVQSENDKRAFHLEVTEKYMNYYNVSNSYIKEVTERIEKRFSEEEIAMLENMLKITSEELMPELDAIKKK